MENTVGNNNWGQLLYADNARQKNLYNLKISKNAIKVSDLLEPQLYNKTNVEMYKTDYIYEKNEV